MRDTALCAAVDSVDSVDIITRHMLGLATSVTAVARVSQQQQGRCGAPVSSLHDLELPLQLSRTGSSALGHLRNILVVSW